MHAHTDTVPGILAAGLYRQAGLLEISKGLPCEVAVRLSGQGFRFRAKV